MNQFDESYFDLKLTGGQRNSDVIKLEAVFNKGPHKGQQIPLRCKWFSITQRNEYSELEGVVGAFYQACIEDVDTRLMIQAIPILDSQEYLGMPLIKETNIIQQDIKILESVSQAVKKEFMEFTCRLENSNINVLKTNEDLLITLSQNQISFLTVDCDKIVDFAYQDHFPLFKCIKKTNNQGLFIIDDKTTIQIKFTGSFQRDTFVLLLKTFKGKLKVGQQEKQINNGDTNQNLYAKMDDYIQVIEKDKQNINDLKNELKEKQQKQKQLEMSVDKLTKQNDALLKENSSTNQKYDSLEKTNEKLRSKILFMEQEINLYKTQIISYENKNKKSQNLKSEKEQSKEQDPIEELMHRENLEILNNHITKYKEENSQLRGMYEESQITINDLLEQLRGLNEKNEKCENELNSVTRKCQSLVIDNIRRISVKSATQSPKSSSSKQYSANFREFEFQLDYLRDFSVEKEKESEVKTLKDQISKLETNLKSLKIAYDQDLRNSQSNQGNRLWSSFSLTQNSNNQQGVFLQKLANSLAETITEKELALAHSKEINKKLMKKIKELESVDRNQD